MKVILSLVLGVYSVAMCTYALAEIHAVSSDCTAGCYKGESAFAGGAGSSDGKRQVNVKYRATGTNSFAGADTAKLSGALSTATNNWNTKDDGESTSPFRFQADQNTPASNVNVEIILVDEIKGRTGREVCASLETSKNPQTGAIQSATLRIPRKVLEKSSQKDLAEIIQHELAHFIGLADFYGKTPDAADRCQTIMAQAEEGCTKGLQGSESISRADVANVKKYVNNPADCKRDRQPHSAVSGGGGYTDPTPNPNLYPRTCYNYYDAVDLYYCYDGCRYIGTVYYLTDSFCY